MCLTIAGSDCSAGAGIQADLKAMTALETEALTVVTAVVAETPAEVASVEILSSELVACQLRLLLETYPVLAIKTGLLGSGDQIRAMVPLLERWKADSPDHRLVVDPIVSASTGTALAREDTWEALRCELVPLADLITPNLGEAASLLRQIEVALEAATATALAELLSCAVLLKGGHARASAEARDLLLSEVGLTEFRTPRIPGGHRRHGTGCTLSAAITAALAKGQAMEDAVAEGKAYLFDLLQREFA